MTHSVSSSNQTSSKLLWASSAHRTVIPLSDAIISHEVIDIFDAAGIKKPDISILSDEFLAEIRDMLRKNLALELLKRLLNDEIKIRAKTNLVQGRRFSEMLAAAVKRYQSGLVDSAKVIEELIQLAKDIHTTPQQCANMVIAVILADTDSI